MQTKKQVTKLPLRKLDFGFSRQRPHSRHYIYGMIYAPPPKKNHVKVSMPNISECDHIWR